MQTTKNAHNWRAPVPLRRASQRSHHLAGDQAGFDGDERIGVPMRELSI